MNPIVYVLIPLLLGFSNLAFSNLSVHLTKLITLTQLFFVFSLLINLTPRGLTQLVDVPFPFGMALSIDDYSWIMLVLNNVLFLIATFYSTGKSYFSRNMIFELLSLQGIINALLLSVDLFNIYILFEVSTVLVTLLIMAKKDSRSLYDGLIYLMSNLVAMAFFLMGLGFLYKTFGNLDIHSLLIQVKNWTDLRSLTLPLAFILTALSLKSALIPAFGWLPHAHASLAAPTGVSAILSGIFVQIGLYLIYRISIIFSPIVTLGPLLLTLGYATTCIGFIFAICQTDIKSLLAYQTIATSGIILIGIGHGTELSIAASFYHLVAHGLYKPLLFLTAGQMIHLYQSRQISDMHHLWKHSKSLSLFWIIGTFSIIGVPFFGGFMGKNLLLQHWDLYVITFGIALSFMKFIPVIWSASSFEDHTQSVNTSKYERSSLILTAFLCILWGVFSSPILNQVFHISLNDSWTRYLSKLFEYLLILLISYLAHHVMTRNGEKNNALFQRIRRLKMDYNQMNVSLVLLFTFVLGYLTLYR